MGGRLRTIRDIFCAWDIILLILVSCLFFSVVPRAHAHRVYIFAWVEENTVFTESYFGGKKKAIGGVIRVFNVVSGVQLLEGKTNEKGEFSFKMPKKTDLRIVLEATMGHRAEYILKLDEMNEENVAPEAIQPGELKALQHEGKEPAGNREDLERIRAVVEKALDARLQPLTRALAKIQEEKGPGLTEIIGGIGYIFGLMGVILYFKSKKRK
ncbi:hypothetical protein N9174_03850 [bacterium]|nr:hypothetical protein [bacterium]